MKLQLTNHLNGQISIIEGSDAQVDVQLHMLFPGVLSNILRGDLNSAIYELTRLQSVQVEVMDNSLPPIQMVDGIQYDQEVQAPVETFQKSLNEWIYNDSLTKMAIKDIPSGFEIPSLIPSELKRFDYSHVLSPEQYNKGYSIHLKHKTTDYGHRLTVQLLHNKLPAWSEVEGIVRDDNPYEGSSMPERGSDNGLEVEWADVDKNHRGMGLGRSLYEALYAHAHHHLGVKTVFGGNHSSLAHRAHKALAEKHEMDYQAKNNRPDDLTERGFDSKYGPYKYTIKSEEAQTQPLQSSIQVNNELVQDMLGFQPNNHNAFDIARLMSGGSELSLDQIRRTLYEEDGDLESAALRAYDIEPNERTLKTLRGLMSIKSLNKSEQESPQEALPATPEANDVAKAITNAFQAHAAQQVNLNGKYSKGAMVAKDPVTEKIYLLKPSTDGNSPASGVLEESSSQPRREAAYSLIAQSFGLGNFFPRADLVYIDGHEWAVIELLPYNFKSLDRLWKLDKSLIYTLLEYYRKNGTLHKWAILDYILGNPDRHGQNMMVGTNIDNPGKEEVKLIDHGSAFAGIDFDPAHDKNSFVPFYLRYNSPDRFNKLPVGEKLKLMPKLPENEEKNLSEWFSQITANKLRALLEHFAIDPEPSLVRLAKLHIMPGQLDQVIDSAWIGTNALNKSLQKADEDQKPALPKNVVSFKTNVGKLRLGRDHIRSKGVETLPFKDMPPGNWEAGRLRHNNRVSAQKLQEAIDSTLSQNWLFSEGQYGKDYHEPVTCDNCNGTGEEVYSCPSCNGDRRIHPNRRYVAQWIEDMVTENYSEEQIRNYNKCSYCLGKGFVNPFPRDWGGYNSDDRTTCRNCDGIGVELPPNQWPECGDCDGTGEITQKCRNCDGVGEFRQDEPDEDTLISNQQHSGKPSNVWRLDLHDNHVKALKDAGAWETFRKMYNASAHAGHPINENWEGGSRPGGRWAPSHLTGTPSLGWVRYTGDPRHGIHVDEVQSDFGQNWDKQINREIAQKSEDIRLVDPEARLNALQIAQANTEDPNPGELVIKQILNNQGFYDTPEEVTKAKELYRQKILDKFEAIYPKKHRDLIENLLFNKTHPNELIAEGFMQWLRGTNPDTLVHWPSEEFKAPLSNLDSNESNPAHFQFSYRKLPRDKWGMTPAKYGDLDTQETSFWRNKPMWAGPVRKSEKPLQKSPVVFNPSDAWSADIANNPVEHDMEHINSVQIAPNQFVHTYGWPNMPYQRHVLTSSQFPGDYIVDPDENHYPVLAVAGGDRRFDPKYSHPDRRHNFELTSLVVHPQHAGKGYGRLLLGHLANTHNKVISKGTVSRQATEAFKKLSGQYNVQLGPENDNLPGIPHEISMIQKSEKKEACPRCKSDDIKIAIIGEPVYVCQKCDKKWDVPFNGDKESVTKSDSEENHAQALKQTGFWGKQGAGAIVLAKDTGRLLIPHRSSEVQEPNTHGTWGGAIDDGEDPMISTRRELAEEAGYNGKLDLHHVWTFKHPSGFQYHNYLGVVPHEFTPNLNWETQGFNWVKPGEWPNPLHPGLASLIKRPEFKNKLNDLGIKYTER